MKEEDAGYLSSTVPISGVLGDGSAAFDQLCRKVVTQR